MVHSGLVVFFFFFDFFQGVRLGSLLVSYLRSHLIGAYNWGSCIITSLKKSGR
jgi:hypothetical protein